MLTLYAVTSVSFGQDISTSVTQYSQTNNGEVGKESFSFSMTNGTITITDLDYNRSETYEPLKYSENGFDEKGFYYESYNPDILKDPAGWARARKKPRVYKFIYETKNGNLLAVIEVKVEQDNSKTKKIYFTEKGNDLLNASKSETKQSNNESSFDIASVLMNANSLTDISSQIKSSFSGGTEKKYSEDMASYTYEYKNGDRYAIVSYNTTNDNINQVFFLLEKASSVEIAKSSFMSRFTPKKVNGITVWFNSRTGLSYEAGSDGEVGILVIK